MWFAILGSLFTIVNILGNSMVVYLVITKPRLHNTSNWFVVSLALADLFVGLTYFPGICASRSGKEFAIDHTGVWFKVSHTFVYLSSANLCVLTADRYIAITMPLKYSIFMSLRRFSVILILAWVSPLIFFTVPSLFTYSNGNESFTYSFEVVRVVMFQLIPCIIFVYVIARLSMIAKEMSLTDRAIINQIRFNFQIQENTERKRQTERKSSSLKLIVFIISFFILCHVGINYKCFCVPLKLCVMSKALEKVVHLLFVLNSAFNPIVYAVMKKDFKRELKKYQRSDNFKKNGKTMLKRRVVQSSV
ncbi:octopamine receptor beta-1R-like [Montipora capricornis]|uniref:octopamine receptor beta-1R-like n=1 Tax=Montipora capricornis TaxID=246305 RepID=UPI0035F1EE04